MRRKAPAAARNREPIADALEAELPSAGTVLELASGTGEHAVHFARRFTHLAWQPSDPDPVARQSIAAWREHARLDNLLEPLALDAAADDWPQLSAEALLCINMIHISPVAAAEGLVRHAARILPPGAPLIVYGPFLQDGVPTAPSNAAFDQDLKARNPLWGLRSADWLDALASTRGLARSRRLAMPANNLLIVYRQAG